MKAKWLIGFLVSVSILFGMQIARADFLMGHIIDYTFISSGALIKLDMGVPGVCSNTPYGWMLIRNQDAAMMIAVSIIWSERNEQVGVQQVQVYTDGSTSGGFCLLNQVDPVN